MTIGTLQLKLNIIFIFITFYTQIQLASFGFKYIHVGIMCLHLKYGIEESLVFNLTFLKLVLYSLYGSRKERKCLFLNFAHI